MKDESTSNANELLTTAIISTLENSSEPIKVKALRKLVLEDNHKDDKLSKKLFKKTIQLLENENKLALDEDGLCQIIKKRKVVEQSSPKETKKRKKDKMKDKKEKKAKKVEPPSDAEEPEDVADDVSESGSTPVVQTPLKTFTNPQGITRLFIGNLPFAVDEPSLNTHLLSAMTHVKWITDKETGRFYGSAFVEIRSAGESSSIVNTLNGKMLLNRALKIAYAPSRVGDVWPPVPGEEGAKSGPKVKPMSEKPEGCVKLFIGNLSYEIDDDAITKFFSNVDAEMKAVRWLSHIDSGDFKGCGFVEFYNAEACTKAAALNGKHLLGRPIRMDWDSGF